MSSPSLTKQAQGAAIVEAAWREKSRRDPVWFMRQVLGCQPYDRQEQMALAVRDYPRVAVLGANGCLAPESLVFEPIAGESIPIAEYKAGLVFSHLGIAQGYGGFCKGRADLYRITLEDGRQCVATLEHRVLTPQGWKQVRSLHAGDAVAGGPLPVDSGMPQLRHSAIESIRWERFGEYWDMTVPGAHSYLADGVFHHNSGKDFCAARLMLWWQWTHNEALTVVIGPTSRQVTDIVWKEARFAYNASRMPLRGRMFQTARWEYDNRRYAVGFATDSEYNIQGFHSPHLLCILTEAHNLEQSHIEAIKRLNPARILMTGNPFATAGEFFEAFHEKGDLYHTIEVSALDTPNVQHQRLVIPGMVTWEQVQERKREWGEESAMYVASVLGRFPENLEDAVVSRSLLQAAVARTLEPGAGDTALLACDVARFGADKTVIYRRHGAQCRLLWRVQGRDTQQVAGKLKALAEDDPAVTTIVVDDSGVGGGVVDRLREERVRRGQVRVVAFNGGAKAKREDRYVNAITEAWLELAGAFREARIDIDNNPALIAQLSSRRYTLQGDRRLRLEGKEDYKGRAASSPDDADALAMCYTPLAQLAAWPAGGVGQRKASLWPR